MMVRMCDLFLWLFLGALLMSVGMFPLTQSLNAAGLIVCSRTYGAVLSALRARPATAAVAKPFGRLMSHGRHRFFRASQNLPAEIVRVTGLSMRDEDGGWIVSLLLQVNPRGDLPFHVMVETSGPLQPPGQQVWVKFDAVNRFRTMLVQ